MTFGLGDRVTVVRGKYTGARGRITHRAHADVQPRLQWIVTLDDAESEFDWVPVRSDDLGPWTVPPEARPLSVGAMAGGAR